MSAGSLADPATSAFIRELTDSHGELVVIKHLERALRGEGDIDTTAPEQDMTAIADHALALGATTLGASHGIACAHVHGATFVFLVRPERLPDLFEFDIWSRPSRASAEWLDPSKLVTFSEQSPEGVRRLRPGVEAVVLLVYGGLGRDGRCRLREHDRATVTRGLEDDLDGAVRACMSLAPRPAGAALRRLVREFAAGTWSRRTAWTVLAGFAVAGVRDPRFAASRLAAQIRFARGQECSLFRVMRRHGRKVPDGDLDLFLAEAAADGHRVVHFDTVTVPDEADA